MLNVLRLSCCALTACLLSFGSLCAPAMAMVPLENLQLSLMALSNREPGEVGIALEDLPTGQRANVNGSANMPAASVIKIPVMVEVFREMSSGTIALGDRLTLQAHDRDWGWGELANAQIGTSYSIDNLLRLMITKSDNTATNMLIRRVTRGRINATMQHLALSATVLGDDIRSEGDIRSLRTSANDMVTLLDAMVHDRLVDAWSSRQMLAILAGQEHNGLLPVPLPRGIEIAHKTGTLHDTLNDVGVVFLNDNPYVIAVMTTHLPTLDLGRSFIHTVSRLAYTTFSHAQTLNIPLRDAAAQEDNGAMMFQEPILLHSQVGEFDTSLAAPAIPDTTVAKVPDTAIVLPQAQATTGLP